MNLYTPFSFCRWKSVHQMRFSVCTSNHIFIGTLPLWLIDSSIRHWLLNIIGMCVNITGIIDPQLYWNIKSTQLEYQWAVAVFSSIPSAKAEVFYKSWPFQLVGGVFCLHAARHIPTIHTIDLRERIIYVKFFFRVLMKFHFQMHLSGWNSFGVFFFFSGVSFASLEFQCLIEMKNRMLSAKLCDINSIWSLCRACTMSLFFKIIRCMCIKAFKFTFVIFAAHVKWIAMNNAESQWKIIAGWMNHLNRSVVAVFFEVRNTKQTNKNGKTKRNKRKKL